MDDGVVVVGFFEVVFFVEGKEDGFVEVVLCFDEGVEVVG